MLRFLATIVMTIGISLLIAQFNPAAATFLAPVTFVASFVLYGRLRRNRLEASGVCPACRGKRTQPAYEQGIYGPPPRRAFWLYPCSRVIRVP